jgi:type I restriction enzyme S subunit
MATSQGFVNWICGPELLPRFLQQIFLAEQSFLHEISEGVAHTTIYFPEAKAFHVCIPNVVEQRRIVAEIEKQFSRLDEAVANLQRVKTNLKRYKATVLKAAVTGQLVPTDAAQAESAGLQFETGDQLLARIAGMRPSRLTAKRGQHEYSSSVGELPTAHPDGWAWATIEMICDEVVDCPHSTARFQAEGAPCIDTTWMTPDGLIRERARYVDEATYKSRIARLMPKPGDIVFAREGTIGTAIVIPENMKPCLGQRVMLLRTSPLYSNRFLAHSIHSEIVKAQYREQALGSTVAHINVGDVRRFAVPVPPLDEQHRIVSEVDRRLSIVREVEAEVDANLKRAQALRQAVLSRVFSNEPPVG